MEIWLRKYSATASSVTMVYKIKNIDSISFNYNSPITPTPLPEEGGDENQLIKIMGNTNTVNISWTIKEEASDVGFTKSGSGGYGGYSKTIIEQMNYLTDPDTGLLGTGIDDRYELLLVANGAHTSEHFDENFALYTQDEFKKSGYIRNLGFDLSGSEPVTFRAKCDFIEGRVITSYNGNTPSVPRNFTAAKGDSSGNNKNSKMYITWNHPLKNGGSAITNYAIWFRQSSGVSNEWDLTSTSSGSTTAVTLTGLSAATEYEVKVVPMNANGSGESTYIRYVSTDA